MVYFKYLYIVHLPLKVNFVLTENISFAWSSTKKNGWCVKKPNSSQKAKFVIEIVTKIVSLTDFLTGDTIASSMKGFSGTHFATVTKMLQTMMVMWSKVTYHKNYLPLQILCKNPVNDRRQKINDSNMSVTNVFAMTINSITAVLFFHYRYY